MTPEDRARALVKQDWASAETWIGRISAEIRAAVEEERARRDSEWCHQIQQAMEQLPTGDEYRSSPAVPDSVVIEECLRGLINIWTERCAKSGK